MEDFWKPQLKRAKLICNGLTPQSKYNITLDFGSAGMIRDDKMSLHKYLIDNVIGTVIGVDARESDYTDVKHDLNYLPYPFQDTTVNDIIAGEVIEHLHNPFLFLKECYRILKYDGRMVLTTPSAEGIQLLMGRESPWHYYIWTLRDFELLAEAAGFKVVYASRENIYYNRNLLLRGLGYLIPKIRPTLFFILEKRGPIAYNPNKNTKEKKCVLMGCEDDLLYTLGEIIKDKTNEREVINQAKLLIELGFDKTDYFCQDCFWK